MNGAAEWTVLAALGPRQLVLVVLVALILYGRSGVLRSRSLRWLRPWPIDPRGGSAASAGKTPSEDRARDDRAFWFLTIVAAAAVAAWIVTRTLILGAPGASH